jgi:hypothetical protein
MQGHSIAGDSHLRKTPKKDRANPWRSPGCSGRLVEEGRGNRLGKKSCRLLSDLLACLRPEKQHGKKPLKEEVNDEEKTIPKQLP